MGDNSGDKLISIIKDAAKKAMKAILNLIKPALPYIALGVAILLLIGLVVAIFVDFDEMGQTEVSEDNYNNATEGTSAIYDGSISREEFIQKVTNYTPPSGVSSETGITRSEGYQKGFIDMAGDYFDISTNYGLDPRVTFCIGIHESNFGTSRIANDKNNYWGMAAYDNSAYGSAQTYSSIEEGIEYLCELLKNQYVSEGGEHYQEILDKSYDPKTLEGIGSVYASDPSWATNVKKHMQNIFGAGSIDTSSFLATAKSVWLKVCNKYEKEGKPTYGGSSRIPLDEDTMQIIDCSAYASWVLYEYGYEGFEGHQTTTKDFFQINWNEQYGWGEIPVGEKENVIDKIQPGDMLVRWNGNSDVHHITIIAKIENGKVYVYDCGGGAGSERWKKSVDGGPVEYTTFITANRSWAQAPGKIIRVTKPN